MDMGSFCVCFFVKLCYNISKYTGDENMEKDLTASQVDRQNILNNEIAVLEIQKTSKIDCVFFANCNSKLKQN